jgi:hypothetical protein
MLNAEFGKPVNVTSTATIKPIGGQLLGFYVNSTNAGTLVLRDGGSGGTQISGTITPAIGWREFPATFQNSLHATIGGTALNVTFFVT